MLPQHVALVSLSSQLKPADLSQTAAALQKQVMRDLAPIWGVHATVDYFPDIRSVPTGYWPIVITDKLNQPGAGGYHTDIHHQPYSLVLLDDSWQLACSHECCEMLVDPYGNRMLAAESIEPSQGKVNYLVEVCDPCEDASFAYSVNGILVSDFYTPHYFDPVTVASQRYSYTGSITRPCEILKNGYLSWVDPISKQWYQGTFFGGTPVIKPMNGMKDNGDSLRSQVDRLTHNPNHADSFATAAKRHSSRHDLEERSRISTSKHWQDTVAAYITPS